MSSQPLSHVDLYAKFHEHFPPTRLAYRVASDSWDYEGRGITVAELTKLVAFALDSTVQRVSITLAKAAYERSETARIACLSWLKNIEERPQCDRELRRFVTLMQREHTIPMAHEAHVLALKQWIWQVKRGINEKTVVWHVAPIFWSKEGGTGKSLNVKRILEPLSAFTRNVNVNELGEKFSGRLFARTLVAYLDEFAGAELASAAQLKALLTGKPFDSRSMYTESGFYAPNRMSCIATSNIDPPHGFVDHTGARRFWSIHCSGQKMDGDPERAAALDAIDVDKVWAAISVTSQSPQYTAEPSLLKYMEDVREQNLRTKTSLEEFCAECLEPHEGYSIPMKDFQRMYNDYCKEGKQPMVRGSYRTHCNLLKDMGYTTVNKGGRYMIKNMGLIDFTARGEQNE